MKYLDSRKDVRLNVISALNLGCGVSVAIVRSRALSQLVLDPQGIQPVELTTAVRHRGARITEVQLCHSLPGTKRKAQSPLGPGPQPAGSRTPGLRPAWPRTPRLPGVATLVPGASRPIAPKPPNPTGPRVFPSPLYHSTPLNPGAPQGWGGPANVVSPWGSSPQLISMAMQDPMNPKRRRIEPKPSSNGPMPNMQAQGYPHVQRMPIVYKVLPTPAVFRNANQNPSGRQNAQPSQTQPPSHNAH